MCRISTATLERRGVRDDRCSKDAKGARIVNDVNELTWRVGGNFVLCVKEVK